MDTCDEAQSPSGAANCPSEPTSDNTSLASSVAKHEGCQTTTGNSGQQLGGWHLRRRVDKHSAAAVFDKDPCVRDLQSVDEGFQLLSGEVEKPTLEVLAPDTDATEQLASEDNVSTEAADSPQVRPDGASVDEQASQRSPTAPPSAASDVPSSPLPPCRPSVRRRPAFRPACVECGAVDTPLVAVSGGGSDSGDSQQRCRNCSRLTDGESAPATRRTASRRAVKQKRVANTRSALTKGRGRRAIFKKTSVRSPSAFATPITCDHVFHKGVYYQVGDVVCIHAPKSTSHAPKSTSHALQSTSNAPKSTSHAPKSTNHAPISRYYAQIRCLLQDEYCCKSAVLTWLLPTQYSGVTHGDSGVFEPSTYVLGPDEQFPRRLECMSFVCHAPLDLFRRPCSAIYTSCGVTSAIYSQMPLYPPPQRRYKHGFVLERLSPVAVELFGRQPSAVVEQK